MTDHSSTLAIVTGGANGLGLRTATRLAERGAAVVLADINEEAGKAAAASLTDAGHRAAFVHLDVTQDASWAAGIEAATTALGGAPNALVNNAGIEISDLFVDLDPEGMRKILEVNVLGTALGIKHGFRAMRPEGGGSGGAIVNIASVAATIAFPGIAAYSASKSAVERLTKVAAAEAGRLGYGVRVNTVAPGLVPNAMGAQLAVDMERLGLYESTDAAVGAVVGLTPSGRLATEDDIANGVAFLLSPDGEFVNGVTLSIDGAMGM